MAKNTTFFYDWNVDGNGYIYPGNIFLDTKRPFVRGDKSDDEIQHDIDEGDYNIGFNTLQFISNMWVADTSTFLKADLLDEAYKLYRNNGYVYFVRPGTTYMQMPNYLTSIKYEPWLSEGLNADNSVPNIYLYDVGGKQIIGVNSQGQPPTTYIDCTAKNLKYDEDEGYYFAIGNDKYYLYSLSWNKKLKDVGIAGLATWDEHYELKMFVPNGASAQSRKFSVIPVNYGKTNLLNLAQVYPVPVRCHDNEIVAIFAAVPVVDKINLYTTDVKGNVTSVDYYRTKMNVGAMYVWVQNMRRIWPKVDGRDVDKILDEALADETKAWMTPDEFYNKQTTTTKNIKSGEDGYTIAKVKTKDTEEKKTIPVWFWVNTLANWCTFKHGERHCTKLCVWNGRNGWDELDDIIKPVSDTQRILNTYYYDITRFIRGTIINAPLYYNHSSYRYKSIKLTYDSKFSQYDENNFQCIKIGRVHLNDKGTQRYPFTTGIPPIMRLPSGELALVYTLILPGMTKKHEVIYQDHMDFINSVCLAYFGKGDDKTIREDWKRFYKLKDVLEEKASDIVTDDVSTLVDAEEINTIHEEADVMNITMNIPRQYPETLDATKESFVEDWRQ